MRERAAWLVLAILLGGCKGIKENYDKEFRASYIREFGGSCTKAIVGQGVAEPKAKVLCDCVANQLVEHHTTTELTKLSLSVSSPDSQAVIRQARDACEPSVK